MKPQINKSFFNTFSLRFYAHGHHTSLCEGKFKLAYLVFSSFMNPNMIWWCNFIIGIVEMLLLGAKIAQVSWSSHKQSYNNVN